MTGVPSSTRQQPVSDSSPMESQERRQLATPLTHRVGKDANAAQIASTMVAIWQEIEATLTPIIGQRGVSALSRRSLYLTGHAYPWLADAKEGVKAAIDLAVLESAITQQSSADAAAGSTALLQTFHGLLTHLIGVSLAERLLRSVWTNSSGGPPVQDISR